MAETTAPAKTWKRSLAVYADRRVVVMLALGFAAGLPRLLVFDTLSAWLRESGLSLEVIGFFSLATISYAFKFVWAPLVDRTRIPVLHGFLGQRRSWMLISQAAIIAGLWAISGADPATQLVMVAVFAALTGFSSATQDIVMDAWRIEVSEDHEQGAMIAAYTWGYRGAIIVAGAVPLILAQAYGWSLSYFVMAGLMFLGVAATLFAPRERNLLVRPSGEDAPHRRTADLLEWGIRLAILAVGAMVVGSGLAARADVLALPFTDETAATIKAIWTAPRTGVWIQLGGVVLGFAIIVLAAWPLPGRRTRPGAYISRAFGDPVKDFAVRYRGSAMLIVGVICFYRVSEFTLNIMNPYYIDLGFTLIEIAEVRKILGTVATMFGVFAAGAAIARWGLMRPLVVGAFAGPISNLLYAWLATKGANLAALSTAISVDNFSEGFAATCLIAYMSSLTARGFTATQYALFTSLSALPGKLVGSQSGRIIESLARSAEAGVMAPFKNFFSALPEGSLVKGAAGLGVAPAALGAGYAAFFLYTVALGLVSIVLTLMIARRSRG